MNDEIQALKKNDTWDLVPRPQNHIVVGCRWIFKTNLHADGSIECHKARLVAKVFSQIHGLDFEDTSSPVVRPARAVIKPSRAEPVFDLSTLCPATVRIILSIAVTSGWPLHQLDVKNAFIHGHIFEEVYMDQPPGYTDPQFPQHADSSLFIHHITSGTVYLLLYVDDMVLTGNNPALTKTLITRLSTEFAMKDLGSLHYFLGVKVQPNSHGLFLSQTKYALDILQRANMVEAKPITTPFEVGHHLTIEGKLFSDHTLFRSLAGVLQYLKITRLDLSFSVNSIASTGHHGLQLHRTSSHELLAYSDADWAGCPDTRRSTTGYVIFLGANLVSWCSKKQSIVSRFSAEAEYRSLVFATAEVAWIVQLLRDLRLQLPFPPKILCDNKSAIFMAVNPVT
ncbi:hypothetical protein F2P56_037146 [Juglans regia]|uniref:Uncharacterized mitochondrial protein AtMg00810-like n=2 Tax=Juglans regia TaxID=51240 RepID=A0A2I4HKX4_JUGRE|nr:uncharacterized mitochondrial protein AtMg00810-like [Juglans regia]KAF5441902.1 hypothetical protein F2P56_037146 [Juglans regia]